MRRSSALKVLSETQLGHKQALRDHERVTTFRDAETGLDAIVAIHSTARGPAFGGCRYLSYPNFSAALTDALRLSEGMSLKNALADLPFGGGKAVILRKAVAPGARRGLFAAFGRFVEAHAGRYITAEDVGTTVDDMLIVSRSTRFVSGIKGAARGNPGPRTALGVFVSIKAGVAAILGRRDLEGTTVAIQGLGSVGWVLCKLLAAAGCRLVATDVDPAKTQRAFEQFGARRCAPDEVLAQDVDVLAPCALGSVFNPGTTGTVRARIVAGAANNQLLTLEDGDALHSRGVFYLPDFLVNAGGVIAVAREYLGAPDDKTIKAEVCRIEGRARELIERVRSTGDAPARVADAWARSLLAKA